MSSGSHSANFVNKKDGRDWAPVSLPYRAQVLKEVIPVRTVEFTAQHATLTETGGQMRTGTDRCGPVSR